MKTDFIYRRVLLKLSGEALKGQKESGYDEHCIKAMVNKLSNILNNGIELAIVIGAGNIWRGEIGKNVGMDSVKADYMGILGTIMNSLILKDAFELRGIKCKIQTSIPMIPFGEPFDHENAIKYLEAGNVVIFAGGTGHPFFTTDTTAALRGLEIEAEVLLKATKVDGVYSDDPFKNPSAKRYEKISFDEALSQNLKIMDATAFSLCKENNLPIVVFNFSSPDGLAKVLRGDTTNATIVS